MSIGKRQAGSRVSAEPVKTTTPAARPAQQPARPVTPAARQTAQPAGPAAPKPAAQEAVRPLNYEQNKILNWLKSVRFRRKLFGGVSENDVWKKIEELNRMYDAALRAERARYDALLQQSRPNQPVGYTTTRPSAPGTYTPATRPIPKREDRP